VVLANKLAMTSDLVRAETVEATGFPHLVTRYQVHGVPRTVINEVLHIEGAVPEAALLKQLAILNDSLRMRELTAEWEKRRTG
jgi:predicted DsbA family dithiol-disulfide isomerase